MEDNLKFNTIIEPDRVVVVLEVSELDLEHESNLQLQIFPRECTFTAAPYHARIPLNRPAKPGQAFPEKLDYEKCTITFHVPLETETTEQGSHDSTIYPYGFHKLYSGPLSLETSQELKVMTNPDEHSFPDRWKMLKECEMKDFNGEHYGIDYIQFNVNQLGLSLKPPPAPNKLNEDQRYRIRVIVEEKQREKEVYSSIEDHNSVLLGLIDILFAIAYDRLTNDTELNEANSHLNIHWISATLSYFVEFDDVHQLLRSFYRRSCTYPYYRHKEITKACVEYVINSLTSEERRDWIHQQLVHAYDAFKTTDCAVLNHYFIKDYIRYVESSLNVVRLLEITSVVEKTHTDVHQALLGFGEQLVVQKLLKEIISQDDSNSTDSDDYESTEDENDGSSSDSESVASDHGSTPNENVLKRLMNLKLSS